MYGIHYLFNVFHLNYVASGKKSPCLKYPCFSLWSQVPTESSAKMSPMLACEWGGGQSQVGHGKNPVYKKKGQCGKSHTWIISELSTFWEDSENILEMRFLSGLVAMRFALKRCQIMATDVYLEKN